MKAVALILALAVIAGCNARAVIPDQTPPIWEETVDRFWRYIAELNTKADGVVDNLKASQLTRELDTLITDTMAEISVYKQDVTTKLGPYADDTTGQLTQDLQLLVDRLQSDMLEAKEKSRVYLEEVKSLVEQNADETNTRISSYTHKLKKRLNKDTEAIRTTVENYLSEVQSRASQNLGVVKKRVEPYFSQVHGTATEKLTSFTDLLKTQADQLETQAESLRGQLEATAEELRTSMDAKMDQLGEMLSPYAAKIREQIQTIIEKVKETSSD
ncbi:Apolipoprotein Eb [Merluccius polli]|uniref:Apolipoprotein Eb n=1 Tax=Merluccius polli TaxID=89951 RepID=A0AA47N1X9_MERPO|nr:Apolipoprotein Eb [Merluccius polli]